MKVTFISFKAKNLLLALSKSNTWLINKVKLKLAAEEVIGHILHTERVCKGISAWNKNDQFGDYWHLYPTWVTSGRALTDGSLMYYTHSKIWDVRMAMYPRRKIVLKGNFLTGFH